jgi:RNA polymerase sigma-B factor
VAAWTRNHDPELLQEIVAEHWGLARWAAERFCDRGEPSDDLVQVALLGLVKAVNRYDPDLGPEFSGFAVVTMLGELKRHLRDHGWAVHLPRPVHDRFLRVSKASEELTQELGCSPTLADVAGRAGVAVDEVVEALEVGSAWRPTSLDAPVGSDDDRDRGPRSPCLADGGDLAAAEDHVVFDALIQPLPPRLRTLVRLRFVDDLTQSEIARRLGVSQMQVSRLLSQSLNTLREQACGASAAGEADTPALTPRRVPAA